MCGIAGWISDSLNDTTEVGTVLAKLSHRGPDDCGIWRDPVCGLTLAHTRLSILDLSPEGHQPMRSHFGKERFVIVFNGEIYNFLELKKDLEREGAHFHGGSDTEVMLAAFEYWGLRAAVDRFEGMFAFAIWDSDAKKLYLVRDRVGEKPLYYGWGKNGFCFSSEVSALRSAGLISGTLNLDALSLYLNYSYVPAPWSVYKGIFKLLPGTILELAAEDLQIGPNSFSPWADSDTRIHPKTYWDLVPSTTIDSNQTFDDCLDKLDGLLTCAVKHQMVADVPVGAFLSGGIDSSLLVALMQRSSPSPVRTFTIGFHETSFNEAPQAKQVAEYLRTEHTELYVGQDEILSAIPEMARVYDEPFADSSQIPTFLLAKLTKNQVTVSLSGDGGDELFGGYQRYAWGCALWPIITRTPRLLRQVERFGLRFLATNLAALVQLGLCPTSKLDLASKMARLSNYLLSINRNEFYHRMIRLSSTQALGCRDLKESSLVSETLDHGHSGDLMAMMTHVDLKNYLPDDILVKVDRATMAVGLESRAPFLSHKIVEFSRNMPNSYKLKGGINKHLLRELTYRYIPKAIVDRPKMGFGAPVSRWLNGPLNTWANDLFSGDLTWLEDIIDLKSLKRSWSNHQKHKHDWGAELWTALMALNWKDVERI